MLMPMMYDDDGTVARTYATWCHALFVRFDVDRRFRKTLSGTGELGMAETWGSLSVSVYLYLCPFVQCLWLVSVPLVPRHLLSLWRIVTDSQTTHDTMNTAPRRLDRRNDHQKINNLPATHIKKADLKKVIRTCIRLGTRLVEINGYTTHAFQRSGLPWWFFVPLRAHDNSNIPPWTSIYTLNLRTVLTPFRVICHGKSRQCDMIHMGIRSTWNRQGRIILQSHHPFLSNKKGKRRALNSAIVCRRTYTLGTHWHWCEPVNDISSPRVVGICVCKCAYAP